MVDLFVISKNKEFDENSRFVFGYKNSIDNSIGYFSNYKKDIVPQYDNLDKSSLVSQNELETIIVLNSQYNFISQNIIFFAIEVQHKRWIFEDNNFRKKYLQNYYPGFIDLLMLGSKMSNYESDNYSIKHKKIDQTQCDLIEYLEISLNSQIKDYENFLRIFNSLNIDRSVEILSKNFDLITNRKVNVNIDKLISFCRNFSRYEKYYRQLGIVLANCFLVKPVLDLSDSWIYCISDCGEVELLAQIRHLLLESITNAKSINFVKESWFESGILYRNPKLEYYHQITARQAVIMDKVDNRNLPFYEEKLGLFLKLDKRNHYYDIRIALLTRNKTIENEKKTIFDFVFKR